ncbi:putative signal transducing protein [Kordia zhangzhouensis]|uniref:putative signal transducing protein n=1 Tax=Kordia zhangzhouensis TaxID=1620405 RepID=UPI0006292807|nr:DUF2007 domain-containing protein [Kordia zhangzhouensis]
MEKKKIYSTDSQIQVMDAKHLLEEAGINYFEINKMDSSYAGILGGSIELHVAEEDVSKAIAVLNELK